MALNGPFDEIPFEQMRISPVRVIQKKTRGEFGMIYHLSYFDGSSVNNYIPEEFSLVKYARVDDAIKIIKWLGSRSLLVKTNICNAF